MDELSWRARLAKSNINILGIDGNRWYYEFMYHPRPGQTKWCKTYFDVPISSECATDSDNDCNARVLQEEVLNLRKELEG